MTRDTWAAAARIAMWLGGAAWGIGFIAQFMA
jgi:hypothetical protein